MKQPPPSNDASATSEDDFPATGRVAAIDFGTVRIGIAVCDPDRILASPLAVLSAQQIRDDADYFGNLVRDQRIAGLVVGLPIHCDGGESQTSMKCREFARWLAGQTGIPVRLFDERFTTSDADQRIAAGGFSRQQRKARIDAVAAAVLLESFLESCRYSGKIVGENIASKPIGGDSLD